MNNISEDALLEKLMCSDFSDINNPNEFRYLLSNFKKYYRILHGRTSTDIDSLKFEIRTLKEIIDNISEKNSELDERNRILISENLSLKKIRSLSFKERLLGKTKQQ